MIMFYLCRNTSNIYVTCISCEYRKPSLKSICSKSFQTKVYVLKTPTFAITLPHPHLFLPHSSTHHAFCCDSVSKRGQETEQFERGAGATRWRGTPKSRYGAVHAQKGRFQTRVWKTQTSPFENIPSSIAGNSCLTSGGGTAT